MMRRILQPIGRVAPHGTSGYGETTNRPRGSSNPHRGIDFNYVGGQEARLNKSHPALRSPVDGVVENAGEDKWGTIAIRDKDGLLHQILHSNARHVKIGDPVAAGQILGTMGNTGLIRKDGKKGDLHVHYQIKDPSGNLIDPRAFSDALGPFDPNPAPPAYIPEYRQYLRDARTVPATSPADVRILTRMPAGSPSRSAFDSEPIAVPEAGPASTLPPAAQKQFGGLFGLWPPFSENAAAPDLSQTRQRQLDTPDTEDWSTMWRRRTGLP
ncbi:M23 family metallopeptidase [Bradyrhizobium sp. SSUT77]|uniref:M23 family metallopeptidase n=1 Tax=Bradyrhizobium sp. SSUT77 TaxID=3040603 RepID=UPI00244A3CEE|nr:M23 family metallopeptidase [Bradyrhizobium sp. SSUT77]MDH2341689.1 M23 family metallopeptidase [Bradyrhizobium sp. SSUT77]